MVQKRILKKEDPDAMTDPDAIEFLGGKYRDGQLGLQKGMQMAVELWTEAAELVSIKAIHNLGGLYASGMGFRRTRQRLRSSGRRRQCKDMSRIGTTLTLLKWRRGTTTAP